MTGVARVAGVVDGVALEGEIPAPIVGPHLLEAAVANEDNVDRATAVHVGESGIHGMLGHHRARIIRGSMTGRPVHIDAEVWGTDELVDFGEAPFHPQ